MKIYIVLLSLITIFTNTGVLGQEKDRINVEETPVWVTVPKSIVKVDYVYTGYPSLHFYLPPNPNGSISGFPKYNIELQNKETNKSLAEIKSERQEYSEIVDLKIDGRDAFERTNDTEGIASFSDGGSARSTFLNYELLIENDGEKYSCNMMDSPSGFEKSLIIAKELCYSIEFE